MGQTWIMSSFANKNSSEVSQKSRYAIPVNRSIRREPAHCVQWRTIGNK